MDKTEYSSIQDYISKAPEQTRDKLIQLYETIKEVLPAEIEETISYQMPTFKINGKAVVYFGAFAKHISLFPFPSGIKEFEEETKNYTTSTGTIQFPLNEDLPVDLIKRITKFRVEEVMNKAAKSYGRG